eukprot:6198491-Pleurochrysis_carterae.AAC.6
MLVEAVLLLRTTHVKAHDTLKDILISFVCELVKMRGMLRYGILMHHSACLQHAHRSRNFLHTRIHARTTHVRTQRARRERAY